MHGPINCVKTIRDFLRSEACSYPGNVNQEYDGRGAGLESKTWIIGGPYRSSHPSQRL